MKNRYRVVTDAYAGYEAQVKYWWFPFCYFQIGINTFPSIERAQQFIAKAKHKIVWIDDPVQEANRIIKSKYEQ